MSAKANISKKSVNTSRFKYRHIDDRIRSKTNQATLGIVYWPRERFPFLANIKATLEQVGTIIVSRSNAILLFLSID